MPFYEIFHITPLSDEQQDRLADSITTLHTQSFAAPRLFVNVHFTDASAKRAYVAGKRRSTNIIKANVRHGPSRSTEDYNQLCSAIESAWKDIVGSSGDKELRAIFILGDIVAGREIGFELPAAGQDREWLKSNMPAFELRANEGDEDLKDLVAEVKQRKDLQ